MTAPLSLDTGQARLAAAPTADERERLHGAAKQFEAIFLRQMLSVARSTDFGGNDLFGGQGEETFQEMRDARFAEIAADSGAIGLAASIEQQLARYIGKA
jgi:flagellar protein FlgJ